jgi:carboxyl-terminal processing protease
LPIRVPSGAAPHPLTVIRSLSMPQRSFATRLRIIYLPCVVGLLLISLRLPAEPVPGKQDRMVVQMVCAFLQRDHLSQPAIGDDLSRKLFRRFLKNIDPNKGYLLQSDVDDFRRFETELDDQLLRGDMSFAYQVYQRFATRAAERLPLIEQLIQAPHDFTVKEYLETDFDSLDYARTQDELKERWRKRIKFDLLLERLGTNPTPEAEAKKKILERYKGVLKRWKQVDNYDLMEIYLSDLTTSIDPHSTYMSPATLDDFAIAMRLHLEGIGALLRSENGQTIVVEVVPGGAAAGDGRLKPNDKIIAVAQDDGKFVDVVDMKLREVVKLIRGPRGTKVQLKVVPANKIEPVLYVFTRQNIELKDQEARQEVIDQGKKPDGTPYRVGVIDLPSFYADTNSESGEGKSATEDVRRILKDFLAKGVDGVILDLRRNGGGSLNEALALTGLFIDEGPVVQVKGPRGGVERRDDPERGTVYSGPLMVLTSHLSASASEILAGALQDYGRALVVGDSTTHGKGTVQMLIDLGQQLRTGEAPPKIGALKLTIQQFYRVNGDSTQNHGVASDIVLPSITDHLGTGEKELEHALAFDRVQPVEHEELAQVSSKLKADLRARSVQRVKQSPDFTKLAKEIERLEAQRARKTIPLNEKELREQFNKDEAEKADQKNGLLPPEKPEKVYKFARNFASDEILHVMVDLIEAQPKK